MDFEEGDKVYLKITLMKGVVKFGNKKNFCPRSMGPYEKFHSVGKVAYEMKLPSELASVHPVFSMSMLKKCIGDPESTLPINRLGVKDNLSYEELPVHILDRQVKKL